MDTTENPAAITKYSIINIVKDNPGITIHELLEMFDPGAERRVASEALDKAVCCKPCSGGKVLRRLGPVEIQKDPHDGERRLVLRREPEDGQPEMHYDPHQFAEMGAKWYANPVEFIDNLFRRPTQGRMKPSD